MRRWSPLVSLLALAFAACGVGVGVGVGEGGTTGQAAPTIRVEQSAASPKEEVPSALDNPDDERLPRPLVDTDEIISGGPPPDGIPAIDEPTFQRAEEVDWLEAGRVAGGRDVGATGVFSSTLGGRTLTFSARGDEFVDAETGSTWDILGAATGGPLQGERLDAIPHVDTFWFAWAAYLPDTTIVR